MARCADIDGGSRLYYGDVLAAVGNPVDVIKGK